MHEYCREESIPWGDLKEQGKERTANAMLITKAWTGRSVLNMSDCLGMPESTASDWVNHVATLEEAPEYPNEQWAATDSGYFAE